MAPAYATRKHDKEEVPADPKIFQEALSIIHQLGLPNKIKLASMFMLHRTYISPRKLFNMKKLANQEHLECPTCHLQATLFHCTIECLLPSTFLLLFKKFILLHHHNFKHIVENFDHLQLFFTFPHRFKNVPTSILVNWIILWTWIKIASMDLHINEDYLIERFKSQHACVQICRAIRLTKTSLNLMHKQTQWISSFESFINDNPQDIVIAYYDATLIDRVGNRSY